MIRWFVRHVSAPLSRASGDLSASNSKFLHKPGGSIGQGRTAMSMAASSCPIAVPAGTRGHRHGSANRRLCILRTRRHARRVQQAPVDAVSGPVWLLGDTGRTAQSPFDGFGTDGEATLRLAQGGRARAPALQTYMLVDLTPVSASRAPAAKNAAPGKEGLDIGGTRRPDTVRSAQPKSTAGNTRPLPCGRGLAGAGQAVSAACLGRGRRESGIAAPPTPGATVGEPSTI